jgi:hypothetical protein
MNEHERRVYREKVAAMSDDEFRSDVERYSLLAARTTRWSAYDERCSILCEHNTPLYDAVRMRLRRELRPT